VNIDTFSFGDNRVSTFFLLLSSFDFEENRDSEIKKKKPADIKNEIFEHCHINMQQMHVYSKKTEI